MYTDSIAKIYEFDFLINCFDMTVNSFSNYYPQAVCSNTFVSYNIAWIMQIFYQNKDLKYKFSMILAQSTFKLYTISKLINTLLMTYFTYNS